VRPVSAIVLALVPTVVLAVLVVGSGAAEIVLDHDVLGRDEAGMPALASMPFLRGVIDVWNLLVIYAGPPLIAVLFLVLGRHRWRWNVNALMLGGAAVCVIGGFVNFEAVWTGVKGTSNLVIGPVESTTLGIVRAVVNLALFGLAAFLLLPRKE
jgi:hypothetical protein